MRKIEGDRFKLGFYINGKIIAEEKFGYLVNGYNFLYSIHMNNTFNEILQEVEKIFYNDDENLEFLKDFTNEDLKFHKKELYYSFGNMPKIEVLIKLDDNIVISKSTKLSSKYNSVSLYSINFYNLLFDYIEYFMTLIEDKKYNFDTEYRLIANLGYNTHAARSMSDDEKEIAIKRGYT